MLRPQAGPLARETTCPRKKNVRFDAGATPDLGIIFRPAILLPIVGLALLALLPIAYRKLKSSPAQPLGELPRSEDPT